MADEVPVSNAPLSGDQGNDGMTATAAEALLGAGRTAGTGLIEGARSLSASAVGPWALLVLGGAVVVLTLSGKRRWF
ncbi:MAG: hypothetical protein AB7G36_18805 [Candidatus Nanopelagicales bacterium]